MIAAVRKRPKGVRGQLSLLDLCFKCFEEAGAERLGGFPFDSGHAEVFGTALAEGVLGDPVAFFGNGGGVEGEKEERGERESGCQNGGEGHAIGGMTAISEGAADQDPNQVGEKKGG